jgi:hypothetical protein
LLRARTKKNSFARYVQVVLRKYNESVKRYESVASSGGHKLGRSSIAGELAALRSAKQHLPKEQYEVLRKRIKGKISLYKKEENVKGKYSNILLLPVFQGKITIEELSKLTDFQIWAVYILPYLQESIEQMTDLVEEYEKMKKYK